MYLGKPHERKKYHRNTARQRDWLTTTMSGVLYSPASSDVALESKRQRYLALFVVLAVAHVAFSAALFADVWENGAYSSARWRLCSVDMGRRFAAVAARAQAIWRRVRCILSIAMQE